SSECYFANIVATRLWRVLADDSQTAHGAVATGLSCGMSPVRREIPVESRLYHPHKGLRKKPVAKKRGHQQRHWHTQARPKIGQSLPVLANGAHERLPIRSQHVNRRDHHAPQRKQGADLENVKALDFPTLPERAKKDHDFPRKISEAREADCSKHAESKR